AAAAAARGVHAALTAADLELRDMPHGEAPAAMARPVLVRDTVRFAGEAVAVVVADTPGAAADAADLVELDYEPLDAVVDPARALDGDAPLLFPAHGTNLASEGTMGAGPALGGAEVVVRARFRNQRLAPVPMEPSCAVALPDPDGGGVTLWTPCQAPFSVRDAVAHVTGLPADRVRVIAPAVGGAFGGRIPPYPEQAVVAALALRLRRPVRYVETRTETMLTMQHGRAQLQEVELGARRDGTLTGLRVRILADGGAYPQEQVSLPELTGRMCSGVYRIGRIDFAYRCVVTNTTPTGSYRGAGRPEATALLERTMDILAHRLGADPVELRRRNLIAPGDFPYVTPTGARYDSGDYAGAIGGVLDAAGYDALRAEQAARRRRGDRALLGIGLSAYVEWTGFGAERATCTVGEDGVATITCGTAPSGQGHETAWSQLVSGTLGMPLADVRVVHADTARVDRGEGTMGSRSLQVGGTAVAGAAEQTLEKARTLASHLLEVAPDDVVVVPGAGLGVAGAPAVTLSWSELARAAADDARRPDGMAPGLHGRSRFKTPDATYPFGAHLAVVEVDAETGQAKLVRYATVDDAGTLLNPLIAEGQIHGGIAQGAAQALLEEVVFDEHGTCVTGSLVAYAVPSAAEFPLFETTRTETPTPRNALGAKGIGESGTTGASAAVWNAVCDAVAHLGVEHVEMPATPERLWRAMRDAGAGVTPPAGAGRAPVPRP
ncbi:MAG TPA: molybdopterin cofactor-binding domain-containing protein, partial [Solirubrobacteraceae bacterium]|nr:molybdopterin cofactor-binding domain-containing protein [Solirubrobacteraceae bacterium]